jgi:hypothetical protein
MKYSLSVFLLVIFYTGRAQNIVKISADKSSYKLIVNGKPYFIKGAVGKDYLEKLKRYGGNSIRTNSEKEVLDEAHHLGLTALVNLPVRAERDGMNYDDAEAVRKQHEKVMEIVNRLKSHPAVIMWSLGNELDFIQANVKEHYNINVWDAVNALAEEIHRVDPNHPVMTVVGSINDEKINDLINKCSALDLLGINEYGDLDEIPSWIRKFGWKKPYVVTEWGPTGFWQVKHTKWKVPIEETSSMKAAKYKERYESTIASDKEMCLGSYVFLWRQHQERTHTWFGMFDASGNETEAVDVMQYEWTGKWPENRVPSLDSMKIGDRTAYDNIYLQPDEKYSAAVWISDPDKDVIEYKWEILPEGTRFPYGGNGERKAPAIEGLIGYAGQSKISFSAPKKEGAYRLFVYGYDGHGNWATANVPFYVKGK